MCPFSSSQVFLFPISGSYVTFSSLHPTPFFCHLFSNSLITFNFLRLIKDQAAHSSWRAYVLKEGMFRHKKQESDVEEIFSVPLKSHPRVVNKLCIKFASSVQDMFTRFWFITFIFCLIINAF